MPSLCPLQPDLGCSAHLARRDASREAARRVEVDAVEPAVLRRAALALAIAAMLGRDVALKQTMVAQAVDVVAVAAQIARVERRMDDGRVYRRC